MTAHDVPLPYAPTLEDFVLPQTSDIVARGPLAGGVLGTRRGCDMARIDVIMPQMGESIAEGTLSRWMKKVGDAVKRDEPIFEISTDKVDAEIPAPQRRRPRRDPGPGRPDGGGPDRRGPDRDRRDAAAAAPPAQQPRLPRRRRPPRPRSPAARAGARSPPRLPPLPRRAAAPPAAARHGRRSRPRSGSAGSRTPLVRKIAAEHNLDISAIPGSGLAGRVTKNDVLTLPRDAGRSRPAAAGGPAGPSRPAAPPARGASRLIEVPAPVVEPWEGDRVEPWSKIRKLTADHMIMSRRVSAHVNSLFEVDYTRVAQVRAARKKASTPSAA